MALPDKNLTLNTNSDPGVDLGEEDLEKLESEVLQMAQKISDYRKTLPDQLRNTLSSVLSSQQPIFPNVESASDLGPSRLTIPEPINLHSDSDGSVNYCQYVVGLSIHGLKPGVCLHLYNEQHN
ncbi:PREDICTED: uncharacterized protein LOC104817023 isoform X2 [Tarenaya hassleriana]|uniref:uncharacterized protein LOC104817023 isoform X2 n=1 Tax=Tarenaya hassleriana TaxID=28532 RepID=UPI00053CA219|nr:PREDICTED: uncharacterized protein LOC104817023 isoform X2 [Tarenaya hassleriana]